MSAKPRRPRYAASRRESRFGFTLIELMVVLALTLVMMTMFAVIFSMTGTFVTKQKAVGENDQSARILTTVLKTDLQARTMNLVAPFHPNMASLGSTEGNCLGYFYISENNPLDDTDDILQFTVALNGTAFTHTTYPSAGTQFYGTATFLPAPWQAATTYPPGALVRPTNPNATGYVYKNKTGGNLTSGGGEPNWNNLTPAAPPIIPGTSTATDNGQQWTLLLSPVDQPDGDDGVLLYQTPTPTTPQPAAPAPLPPYRTLNPAGSGPNNTGASPFAEISYFLRHGNLYRRVLPIRNPYDPGTQPNSQPVDTDTPAAPLIPGLYPPYPMTPTAAGSGNFWTDFDYAARIQPFINPPTWTPNAPEALGSTVLPTTPNGFIFTCTAAGTTGPTQPAVWPTTAGGTVGDGSVTWTATAPPTVPTGVNFLASGLAENSLSNLAGAATIPIGRPDNRFGFDQIFSTAAAPPTQNGAPREYDSTGAFFGRYTHEETSNDNPATAFLFPGNLPLLAGVFTSPMGVNSPLTLDPTAFTMSLGNPATVSFAGGPRRGEDILLTNVVSFDVKVWDPHYSEVPTGGGVSVDLNRNGVIDPGPGGFADIGHTAPFGDFQQSKNIFSVYGPRVSPAYTVPAAGSNSWVTPAYTTVVNGITYNVNNVFDTWSRTFQFDNFPRNYDTNDPTAISGTTNLYAPAPYRPRLGNPWQPGTPYTAGQTVDPINSANGYTYVCVTPGISQTLAQLNATLPNNVDPFSLSDPIGAPILTNLGVDGTVVWNAQPPVGLQSIQITVKYLDPTQNVLRQVTIVQSLTGQQ